MEVMDGKIAKEMEGKSSEEQERLRLAYQHWGIPISKEKALIRASKAEKLGAVVDGDRGDLRCFDETSTGQPISGLLAVEADPSAEEGIASLLGQGGPLPPVQETSFWNFRLPLERGW